jgi:hypothetical protein
VRVRPESVWNFAINFLPSLVESEMDKSFIIYRAAT